MPTVTTDCIRLRRMTHGEISFFVPADWTSRVSGPSCIFTLPGWEGKGFVQIVVHRDCTHRGEGIAILGEVESFARSQSLELSNRRGHARLAPAAGGDPVFAYGWDMQQGFTTGRMRVFFVEIGGVGLAELMAVGNGRMMEDLEETFVQIARSISHRRLDVGLHETSAVREWRARLGGRVLERVSSFYQSMNGGVTNSEQYTLASDGTYRHTQLRSASFQRIGGMSSQSEERGTWRIEAAGDSAVALALDSFRGGHRKLPLASTSDGILLDRVRYAIR